MVQTSTLRTFRFLDDERHPRFRHNGSSASRSRCLGWCRRHGVRRRGRLYVADFETEGAAFSRRSTPPARRPRSIPSAGARGPAAGSTRSRSTLRETCTFPTRSAGMFSRSIPGRCQCRRSFPTTAETGQSRFPAIRRQRARLRTPPAPASTSRTPPMPASCGWRRDHDATTFAERERRRRYRVRPARPFVVAANQATSGALSTPRPGRSGGWASSGASVRTVRRRAAVPGEPGDRRR